MTGGIVVRGAGRPPAYRTRDGQRVPGVTTILGARKSNIEGLLIWANRLGQEGKSHRDARDQAATAGSVAHALVENAIHGKDPWEGVTLDANDPDMKKTADQAWTGFCAWQEWSKVFAVEYVWTERAFVSEQWKVGGTPDALAKIGGKLALLDWKTSNAVYPDYIMQLAAYRMLVNEAEGRPTRGKAPVTRPVEACYLLRFGKYHGDYHAHSYPASVLAEAWEGFTLLRRMYELDYSLKKVAT